MRSLLKKFSIITLSLFLLTQIIPSVTITGTWKDYLIASVFLSIFILIVLPIGNILIFPLNILTLNFTSWILAIVIIFIWSAVTPNVHIAPWNFPGLPIGPVSFVKTSMPGWEVIIVSAILLTLIRKFLEWLLH